MNLNNLSKMQSNRLSNWLIISVAVFSFLGLLDAGYLTASHYMAFDPGCTVFGDCDTVLKSQYSKLFGIPVQAFGVVYYLIIFILSIIIIDTGNLKMARNLGWLTILGLAASVYFMFLQTFVIKAYCQYCVASAATSTLLFVLGMSILKNIKRWGN
ncbi:MAG: hypothetical protein UW43_C0002G0079 [Candidatus Yanofskybacteria bacterium GW2011_GWA1_44_21]|uniref:Vitamin K epoxide reductase domain-containing protein n=2 Tax=Parcubacteria group TaxID=1794811 RepID=A0A0G0UIN1_9BACT|nr:MAG: hypothetical protein UU38_C0004G0011 [Candidatus Wolfebacteria bacterium GW2011_GWB1_41_12]KKT28901.1 MAG: hypothetical protein UW14_C0001G0012 [Candidatus Yanofskybacteria bacterium GW2011_GWA2_44_10]KKT50795.1 MAG: hypothetical protein UW43_C0002G0079 [Candidatus Yanofskybacteria bacterium GW2011_GWA1_44_21]